MKLNKSTVVLVVICFFVGSLLFLLPAHGETGNTTEKTDSETVKIVSVPEFLAYFPERYQLQSVEVSLAETEVDRLTAFTKIYSKEEIVVDKSYQISNEKETATVLVVYFNENYNRYTILRYADGSFLICDNRHFKGKCSLPDGTISNPIQTSVDINYGRQVDVNSLFNDYLVIVNWASMVSNDPAITRKVTDLYTSSYWIALSGLFTGESQN